MYTHPTSRRLLLLLLLLQGTYFAIEGLMNNPHARPGKNIREQQRLAARYDTRKSTHLVWYRESEDEKETLRRRETCSSALDTRIPVAEGNGKRKREEVSFLKIQ